MSDLLYVAMGGAESSLAAQQVYANNLANVNTPGFRSDFVRFHTEAATGDRFNMRSYVVLDEAGTNFKQGPMMTTGRELDIAVHGEGFIAVQATDGTEAYTRAGNLQIDTSGLLVNASGYQVLGNGGPIAIPPSEKIEIGSDGTITVRPLGQEAGALAQIDDTLPHAHFGALTFS